MTPSQNKRLTTLLKVIQETRRSLDKEAASGMTGIGAQFGTQFDLEEAVWGIVYAEKALARIWEREGFVRELPDSTKDKLRLKPTTFLKR
jgi:hypothetical protein